MTRLRQIEPEPLNDQRWEKIERSLLARLEREASSSPNFSEPGRLARHGWLALAAAALLSVVGLALMLILGRPEAAELENPSRITTGANASHLALRGLSVDVEPQSAVVVGSETSRGRLIVIDQGSIVCDVAPRSQEAPLIVQAGAARVRVLGTRFSVQRLGETALVKVQHGAVEVVVRGERRVISAGEQWPPPSPRASTPVQPPAPAVASPTPSAEVEAPLSTGRSLARGAARSRPSGGPFVGRLPAAAQPTPSRTPSRQDLFEQATALERSDPARAIRRYRELEAGADSWGQHALYARGRLEVSRGNRAEARRALTRYLERFPNGSNAEDARAVLARLK